MYVGIEYTWIKIRGLLRRLYQLRRQLILHIINNHILLYSVLAVLGLYDTLIILVYNNNNNNNLGFIAALGVMQSDWQLRGARFNSRVFHFHMITELGLNTFLRS